jgi:hypothetical protein
MKDQLKESGVEKVFNYITVTLPKSHIEYHSDHILIHDLLENKKYKLILKPHS